jgi:hypothetical protein
VAAEGRLSGRGEDQRARKGEHVAGGSHRVTLHLLRRHVSKRAEYGAHHRHRAVAGQAGDPEIDDPRPVVAQDDVTGLDVPVDQATGVDSRQPLGEPGPERPEFASAKRAVGQNRGFQGRPWIKAVTIQGGSASGSASTTCAV